MTLVESKDNVYDNSSFRWELLINFTDGGFMELHRYYIMPGHGEPKSFGGIATVQFERMPDDIVHDHYVSRAETEPLDRTEVLKAVEIMTADKKLKWDVWYIIKDSEAEF